MFSAATHEAVAQYVVVGPDVVVGIGGGILASSYSYTTAWPGAFVTPNYVAVPPMSHAYAIPARITPFHRAHLGRPMNLLIEQPDWSSSP